MTLEIFRTLDIKLLIQRLQLFGSTALDGNIPLIYLVVIGKFGLAAVLFKRFIRLKPNIVKFITAFQLINLKGLSGSFFLGSVEQLIKKAVPLRRPLN